MKLASCTPYSFRLCSFHSIFCCLFWSPPSFISLFAGLVEAEHAAVKIISPVRNQIFKYGNQSVLFNCTVTQANGSNFQWFLNNTAINPAGKKDTRYWSSFNRTAQHKGEYKCRYGESGIKPATVKVYLAGKL